LEYFGSLREFREPDACEGFFVEISSGKLLAFEFHRFASIMELKMSVIEQQEENLLYTKTEDRPKRALGL